MNKCECGHHWTVHDSWGCIGFQCPCKMIDRTHRFDPELRIAVEVSV